jgi:hypothetical protein
VATVTLRDHLAAQGGDATEIYSRGARVRKRTGPEAADPPTEPTTFVAVRVEPTPELAPQPRGPLCRIICNAHVLEFSEWPEVAWLAALIGALPGPAR